MTSSTGQTSCKPPKLLGSCRFLLCFLCFVATAQLYFIRVSFSMAVVCMTGTRNVNSTDAGYIEGEFNWNRDTVGNLLAAFFYGYTSSLILGGLSSNKFNSKITLTITIGLTSICCLCLTPAARFHWKILLAFRIILGVLSGFAFPVMFNIFVTWSSPSEKATLMAIVFSGMSFSNVVSAPVSSALCFSGVDNGWPLIFYIPGVGCAIWCVIFYLLTSETPENHPRISDEEKSYLETYSCKNIANRDSDTKSKETKKGPIPWKAIFTTPQVYILAIPHLAHAWVMQTVMFNLPLFVNETFNYGILQNGMISTIPHVGMFLISFSGNFHDYLLRRGHWSAIALRKFFNTLGFGTAAILFCLMGLFKDNNLVQITMLIFIGMSGQISGIIGFILSHSDIAGEFSGVLFSLTCTLAQFAGFVNPLLLPVLVQNGTKDEWQNTFYVAAGISSLGTFVFLFFGSMKRASWADGKLEEKPDSPKEMTGLPKEKPDLTLEGDMKKV